MRAVLFIDRNSLYYYGGNIAKPISLAIPNTILQDIEVIDDVAFKKLLMQFLKKYTVKPSIVMICFSSQSYFIKQLQPQKQPPDIPTLLSDFAEIVPFNHVLAKIFTFQKKQAIIALNKDLAYLLRDSLEPFGFKVHGIIPSYVFTGEHAKPFSLPLAQAIIKQFSSLQQVSFPVHEAEPTITETEDKEFSGQEPPKKTNTNLFVMLGVFGLLIVVLVYMLFFFKKTPKKQPTPSKPQQEQVVKAVTPTDPVASPSATTEPEETVPTKQKDELEIQILNGSGIAGQAGDLQEALEDAGFENISLGNAPTQTADKALVVVNKQVSAAIQRELQSILTELELDSRIRTNDDIEGDILITTYQSP